MKKLMALLSVLVLALSLILGGCAKNETSAGDKDQYLTTLLFEPKTLDVNDVEDTSSMLITAHVFEGFAKIENKGDGDRIIPGGAKDWKISDDGLTYTFHLRDHKWSDGQPVTAQQYYDSWLRLLDPSKGFAYSYFLHDVKNARKYNAGECKAEEVGIRIIDDKTFEVTLERATPYFIKKVAFEDLTPIRMDLVNAQGDSYGTDFTKMVWNGPFTIIEYVPGNKVVLEKNSSFWDAENVKLQKITMQNIEEMSTQMQMFESKQLDITGATTDYLKSYTERAKNGEFTATVGNVPSTWYFGFNAKTGGENGLFLSPKVRQAFSLALNREEIVEKLYGRYFPAYGWTPYALTCGDKEFRSEVKEPLKELKKQYDTNEKIAALFKEGVQELGKDPNAKYEFKFVTTGTSSVSKSRQEYWKNAFETVLPVTINLAVQADFNQFTDVLSQGDFDLFWWGWYGDYDDPMTFMDMWVAGGGNNSVFYSNPEYDKLFENVTNEVKDKDRMKIFADMEELVVVKDAAIAPVFYEDTRRFQHNYVKGVQYPLFGPQYEMTYAYTEGRE